MTTIPLEVVAGVDTHADTHHAAVIDTAGRKLADAEFPTTPSGYAALAEFIASFGSVISVGVEGTGSYGAGLSRHLRDSGLEVVEVIRPNRQVRRLRGKTDSIDAYAAAATALSETDNPTPKTADGAAEALRYLMTARRSAIKARTATQAQIKTLLVTAPDSLRERFRNMKDDLLISTLARLRPTANADQVASAVHTTLRSLARRHTQLTAEITDLDTAIKPIVTLTAPALIATKGIGPVSAAQLLITAGDNPNRLRSEAAFAALCGVSPIPASSGKTTRHRLNRGGDRQANAALHRIAVVRMSYHQPTRDYVAKRRAAGSSTKETLRCLKRAIAREIFHLLTHPAAIPTTDDLRPLRKQRGITTITAAQHFNTWPARISDIERGKRRDDDFTHAYRQWLLTA